MGTASFQLAWFGILPDQFPRQNAADALQLAAAILFADSEVRNLPFLTMDQNLANCAEKEGFPVPAALEKLFP